MAAKAEEQIQPAIVGYRCVCGIDHAFETREQVAELLAAIRTHVTKCPLGHSGGIVRAFRSTTDADVIAWLQDLDRLVKARAE